MRGMTMTAMKCGVIVSLVFASLAMTSPIVAQGHGSSLGCGTPSPGPDAVYRICGAVSAPLLIHSVEAEYTETARKAKVSGSVLVNLYVDANGNTGHIRVIRGLGSGLDEKAVEAVRQYKFKPGMKDGKPVRVEMTLQLSFVEPKD
jgi:protein TonB